MSKELDDVYNDLIGTAPEPGTQLALEGLDSDNATGAGNAGDQSDKEINNAGVSTEGVDATKEGKANVDDAGGMKGATPTAPASTDTDIEWDAFVEATEEKSQVPTNQIDLSSFSKALGVEEEFKSQDQIIDYVKKVIDTNKQLNETAVADDLPRELAEAVKIAKSNGDYLSYLEIGSIDYMQEDPVALFEDEVAELFTNADGSFREDEYNDYIESVSAPDKLLRGKQIQRELVAIQERKKAEFRERVALEKAANLRNLEKSLESFEKVGDYKITPKIKKQMFSELSSGKFLDDLGISFNGAHNWGKLLENHFKARYFDAIQNFNKQRASTGERREIINGMSNPSVGKPTKLDNPTQVVQKDPLDFYFDRHNLKK